MDAIDILIALGIALIYLTVFKVQKHFFSNSYFSISQLLIEFESGIRWNRILLRILITVIMTFLLILSLNNYSIVIIGMGLGSLFIVLPNFLSEKYIEYNLQNHKSLYRITLIVFVILNILIVILTINLYEYLYLDQRVNQLIRLTINTVFALFTQWLYVFLTNKINFKRINVQYESNQDENTEVFGNDYYNLHQYDSNLQFNNKIGLLKNRLISSVKFTDEEIISIFKNANEYEIDFEILYSLLCIEKFNRGDFLTRSKEYIGVKILPDFTVKLNPTLGVGQVRLSHAKKYYRNYSEKDLLEALIDKDFNISLTAKIIKDIQENQESENFYLELIKVYTTGVRDSEITNTIRIYYYLFTWLIDNNK